MTGYAIFLGLSCENLHCEKFTGQGHRFKNGIIGLDAIQDV